MSAFARHTSDSRPALHTMAAALCSECGARIKARASVSAAFRQPTGGAGWPVLLPPTFAGKQFDL